MTEWKQKRQHRAHYNRTAHIYNIRYAEEQNFKIKAAVKNLKLGIQYSILDLGCGTGLLFSKIQKTAKNIVGLDISKGMLKKARHNCSMNIHFILADADHVPLQNSRFDMVFAITLIQNIPNPIRTLQEAERITKSNASIIVSGLKKHFTHHSFVKLLKNAKLRAELLITDDDLKCYLAICKKCN